MKTTLTAPLLLSLLLGCSGSDDAAGKSCLDLAREKGHKEIAELLK